MLDVDQQERLSKLAELYPGFDFGAALALVDRRRAEYQLEHGYRREIPLRPADYAPELLNPPPALPDQTPPAQQDTSATIKVWSIPLLWASHAVNHGGGARIWYLARSLDRAGCGWIKRSELWDYLRSLGVGERKRRRWLGDAQALRLLTEGVIRGDPVYMISGLGRGAVALGAQTIGRPSTISARDLVRSGWKSRVWSAYLATLPRPISQETKHLITGVNPRSQRDYQSAQPGGVRKNYAETNLRGSDKITGLREHGRRSAFVGRSGRIMYRLPDIRLVPSFVSRSGLRGRSRKAQKVINRSFYEERAEGYFVRLFHETRTGAETAIKSMAQADNQPLELFTLAYAGRRNNIWTPVSVQL